MRKNQGIKKYVDRNNKFWGESGGGSEIYMGYFYFGNYAVNAPDDNYPKRALDSPTMKVFQDCTALNYTVFNAINHQNNNGYPRGANSLFNDGHVKWEQINELKIHPGGVGGLW